MRKASMRDLIQRFQRGEPLGIPIWDCHAHMGRWVFPVFRDGSAEAMIPVMDRFGVTDMVITHHACMGPFPTEGNRLAKEAADRFPGRIYAWCGYSPHYKDEGADLLERVFADPCFVGIKLHPGTHDTNIDDPRYRPAFEFANAHSLPILIHSWVGGGCRPELVAKAATDFPSAQVIIGHHGGGYDGFKETVEWMARQRNLYCDTVASELAYKMVDRLAEAVGAGRVLFGSDIPFIDLGGQLGKILYSRISDADKADILGGNFLSILRKRKDLPAVKLP